MEERVIFHVDMDYFYAQIEERENPAYAGAPLAVCIISAREGSMGAVATCNYPARRLGIRAGMPCSQAAKTAPQMILVAARKPFYEAVSERIMDALREYCDTLEQVSVDEAYMDVSPRVRGFDGLETYVKKVKAAVYGRERITCSIGAASNKLVAKMASSAKKPDGHTIVPPDQVREFLKRLPASKIQGIGEKTGEKLASMGMKTAEDILPRRLEELEAAFGRARGRLIYDSVRGIDASPVTVRVKGQYGRLASLKADTRDPDEIGRLAEELCRDVGARLKENSMDYQTVTATFVLEDMDVRTRSRTLPSPTGSLTVFSSTAKALIGDFLRAEQSKLRRIGVTASGLTPSGGQKGLADYWGDR
jgi:DNA polymerase IV (archaeal DinB-like DNA polymerase)